MADSPALVETVYFVSRLSSSAIEPEALIGSIVEHLAQRFHPVRVSITLQHHAEPGAGPAFANAGEEITAKSRLSFSKNIALRGGNYGRFQVELIEPGADLKSKLAVFEVIVQQLAIYSERRRLEAAGRRLSEQLAAVTEDLAAFKTVARASGIVAKTKAISVAKAKRWLEAEAARTGRSMAWLADLLVMEQQSFGRSE